MELLTLFAPVLLSLILFGWWFARRLRAIESSREDSSLLLLQQQIEQLRMQMGQALDGNAQAVQQQLSQILGHVNDRLRENADVMSQTQRTLGERLDTAAQVVGNVQRSLGSLEEANRRIYDIGKDIASLQEILRAPKLRGGLGEFFLEDLLAQILPAQHFAVQHGFRSGERVDAVIKLGSSLVPIDAKFPLENFKRIQEAAADDDKLRAKRQFAADVRRHIDAIAAKYILPDEGTYDFALMYIPAENVYYEVVIKDDTADDKSLAGYAMSRRVIPVSPGSLYAYLQAIVLGLRGMKIEERAKEIIQYLSRLQGDFGRFREEFALVGKHLGHAQSCYQSTERRVEQFSQKLLSADADPQDLSHYASELRAR